MWKVCDSQLNILSEWTTLAGAKAGARIRSAEYPGRVFFVCSSSGDIVAGFGGAEGVRERFASEAEIQEALDFGRTVDQHLR